MKVRKKNKVMVSIKDYVKKLLDPIRNYWMKRQMKKEKELELKSAIIREYNKAFCFVEHIRHHLWGKGIDGNVTTRRINVVCKICGKNIDQIFEEEGVKK